MRGLGNRLLVSQHEAGTEGLGMHVLHCIIHSLRWLRVMNKCIRRTHVDQRLPMLLPEHSADELAEHGQELGEGTSGTAQLLDVTPLMLPA